MNPLARVFSFLIGTITLLVACAAPPTPRPSPTATMTRALTAPLPTPTPIPLPPTLPPRTITATPIPLAAPQPTPHPRQFDDVDARALLSALFPDLKFTPDADAFRVNDDPNWAMWITSRVEGRFTQDAAPELAAIIANDAPQFAAESAARDAPAGSFLAIFQRPDRKLKVIQRAFIFPTALAPSAFDARIERATDFDRDGQDELLIVTRSDTLGISTAAAFLYLWDDQAFVPIWSAVIAEDNTSALNQPEYFATESEIRFADLDGDGWDEIIVDGVRIEYARDAQGLADPDRETRRRKYRNAYHWNGAAFVLDPARATPVPQK
ncbi:MAG: VCBS repeat-containing protein [Chloroflexi bacterium]|nr:VCBS repeat-containing protein [Chloroflexota bacterium]